jgi:hypothetical protein
LIHNDHLLVAPCGSPRDPEHFPFVVLGNKIDLDGRQVRCGQPKGFHVLVRRLVAGG